MYKILFNFFFGPENFFNKLLLALNLFISVVFCALELKSSSSDFCNFSLLKGG